MAIGLSRSKNLSESNLNLKTALQKLYAPGIEDDIELFSLSSSITSSCFSGLFSDESKQIYRLVTEKLRTLSGDVIKRTKFSTRFFTFSEENKVYFEDYTAGIGSDTAASEPRYSSAGSIPATEVISGGNGFYFLNSQDAIANLENFSGTWSAVSSSTIEISTTVPHGLLEGQGVNLRFNNSSGGTNATAGEYLVSNVLSPSSFTVINFGGSISGSGAVSVVVNEIRLTNVQLRGELSGATNAKANVTFVRSDYSYLPGVSAVYSNTSFGTELGSTALTTILLENHGLSDGSSVYISSVTGTLQSGFVSSIVLVDADRFSVSLPVSSANASQSCIVRSVDELTRFTPSYGSRFSVKSIEVIDDGSNYVIPEELTIIEGTFNDINTGQVIKVRKQTGQFFDGAPEIIRTKFFTYTVKNASKDGFFLFDEEKNEYLFLDRDTLTTGLTTSQNIILSRFDGVNINNILRFKFAQSTLYLRGYDDYTTSIGESISSTITLLGSSANNLDQRSKLAIQNTKRPTPATSEENIFGYTYNSFSGSDVLVWQRVVMRDQDYVLNPADTTLGVGSITGTRLRTSVTNFVMGPIVPWVATTGVVVISLADHPVQDGSIVKVDNIVASSGIVFSDGEYVATYINSSSFSINVSSSVSGTGTLNLITSDTDFQVRVPGLFIKVGTEYKRAFSTTDKPFFQFIVDAAGTGAYANPTISGTGASFSGQALGALSAEATLSTTNPVVTSWYSYSTTISELAQRIHTNGTDGAFYYHRPTAPTVGNISVVKNGVSSTIYSVPLFTIDS